MKYFSIPAAFCPEISIHPSIDYSKVVENVLKSYPGANGDALLALTWNTKHQQMGIEMQNFTSKTI